jgi:hypothetical protein
MEKLRNSRFAMQIDEATDCSGVAIQIDEATDCSGVAHLIAYVRYVENKTFNEDMLFCKPVKSKETALEIFKIVDDFITEKNIKWPDCVGVCTDEARVMAGNTQGLRALSNSRHQKLCGHTVSYTKNHWLRTSYVQN